MVVFAYDGSELAAFAIEQAGTQLATGGDALVVTVWQPADVGFVPTGTRHFDANEASEVKRAAEETAAYGAALAEKAGFRAHGVAVKAVPTWKGIVETAEKQEATLIVLGSHSRAGLAGHLLGSVAAAVVKHSPASVFVVHERSSATTAG